LGFSSGLPGAAGNDVAGDAATEASQLSYWSGSLVKVKHFAFRRNMDG
jgi:hypothetical protein